MNPSYKFALHRLVLCGLWATAANALAQSTSAPEPPKDPVIILDPFTITVGPDEGYFSKSTAAFGRVVMSLENVPQKVDVYNAQFIADIVPTSITDITRYSTAVNY
ncbi:MAG: hypothetical protein ACREH8_20640, partial [Opitutaceae bacterium]